MLAAGCGDKSAIALSASIDGAAVTVEQVTLGTRLAGGFDLLLELGPSASAATTVSLGAFALLRASDLSGLVQPLPLTSDVELPVSVGVGKRIDVHLTLDDQKLLRADDEGRICAEPVVIKGTVTDSLSGDEVTNVSSPAFPAGGC